MLLWEATGPRECSGDWEGRLWMTGNPADRTAGWGHLHASSAEAQRCAEKLAVRLNRERVPFGYYLGYYIELAAHECLPVLVGNAERVRG